MYQKEGNLVKRSAVMRALLVATSRFWLLGVLAATLGSVPAAAAEHLYVTNTGSFNVSAFTINSDGSLTLVPGSPFPVGNFPAFTLVDLKHRFLYVTAGSGGGSSAIWGFHINTDGSLTPVPGSPFATPAATTGGGAAVSEPGGDFLYLTNSNNTVSVYSISLADGSLTLLSPLTVPTGNNPFKAAVDPASEFLYVANLNADNSNNISAYRINDTSGALKLIPFSPFASGMGSADPAIDPSGQFAYVTNASDNDVSAFTILRRGGLTPVCTSPFAAHTSPLAVAVDPKHRFVYVGNGSSIDISAYTLNLANGSLTQINGSPFPAPKVGGDIHDVAVDPAGKFLYVSLFTEGNDNVAGFRINSDGSLTPLSGSPFVQPGFAPSGVKATPF
jgi:6-phosphogluconolactonase